MCTAAAAAAACCLWPAAIARAVAIASFVVFLGSVPSLHHAVTMTHPYKADATLVDYTFCSLVFPPMLLGIKAGRQPLPSTRCVIDATSAT
jgi:hypothetical protein